MKRFRMIFTILALAWMVVIFLYSSMDGDDSKEESLGVGKFVSSIFVRDYEDLPEARQIEIAEAIDYPIRKAAHASEYMILAVFVTFALWKEEWIRKKRSFLGGWAITTAYAATDEFHQLFVPGRAGKVTDVLIDSSGALVGVLLIALFYHIHRKRVEKKMG